MNDLEGKVQGSTTPALTSVSRWAIGLMTAAILGTGAHAQGVARHVGADAVRGIAGFLNPQTGAFTPLPAADPVGVDVAPVTYTGTFSLRFTITIVSGGSQTAPITCSGYASTSNFGGPYATYYETKSAKATRTGSTASCLVSIPYAWVLTTGDNNVFLSYDVYLSDGTGLTLSRSSNASLASFPMPVSGVTTVKNISVTL